MKVASQKIYTLLFDCIIVTERLIFDSCLALPLAEEFQLSRRIGWYRGRQNSKRLRTTI